MLIHRQAAHGMQGRGDHRNKGKLTNQDADGWRKKSMVADSSASSGTQLEASNVLVGDHRISIETYDRSGSYNQTRCDGESVQARSDSVDDHAQVMHIPFLHFLLASHGIFNTYTIHFETLACQDERVSQATD